MTKRYAAGLSVLLAIVLGVAKAVGQPSCMPPMLGNLAAFEDAIWQLDSVGTLAYLAGGSEGLLIVDVADPAVPDVLAVVPVPGDARQVALIPGHALVTTSTRDIHVLDIADPSRPVLQGTYEAMRSSPSAIISDGMHAFVGWSNGIEILDVSDPLAVSLLAWLPSTCGLDLARVGDYLYAACGSIRVIDVRNPVNAFEVRSVSGGLGFNQYIHAANGLLFASSGLSGVSVLSLSNPSHPSVVATFDTPFSAQDMTSSGSILSVADGLRGIVTVDVSNPVNPIVVGHVETSGWATVLRLAGSSHLLVAEGYGGLRIVNVSNPALPAVVGELDRSGLVTLCGAVAGHPVGAGTEGVKILDRPDHGMLQIIAEIESPTNRVVCDVAGDRVFITETFREYRLLIADVRDPLQPIILSTTPFSRAIRGTVSDGAFAYVMLSHDAGAAETGLLTFDVRDPLNPQPVGLTVTPGFPLQAAMGRDVVLVAELNHAAVVDIENRAAPVVSGVVEGFVERVAAEGTRGAISLGGASVGVLDISDPSDVAIASEYLAGSDVRGMYLHRGFLAIQGTETAELVDVRDPLMPRQLLLIDIDPPANSIMLDGGALYYTSMGQIIAVDVSSCVRVCDADRDDDFDADIFDLLCFLDAWFRGSADHDGDGQTDLLDVVQFVSDWLSPSTDCL